MATPTSVYCLPYWMCLPTNIILCSNYKSENITQDYSTSQELLNRDNINLTELQQYALDAAHFSTDLPELDFAVSDHVTSCDVL